MEKQLITGTVLAIIFHLLQLLYYSERDARQSCKLANTSADVLDGFQNIISPQLFKAFLLVVASYIVFLLDYAKVITYF